MSEPVIQLEEVAKEPAKHIVWSFREKKGDKEELVAAVNAAKLLDEDRAWLLAKIAKLEGKTFRFDAHAMSEHSGELGGHFHFSKFN